MRMWKKKGGGRRRRRGRGWGQKRRKKRIGHERNVEQWDENDLRTVEER